MSNLFGNKIAAALLASALGFIGINKIASSAMKVDTPASPAYSLAVEETTGHDKPVEQAFPSDLWIASMDVTKGAKVFKKCTSCHNAEDGGKNGTGPALWNIVGRAQGGTSGFSYSTNMTALGGTWGYEELDTFLKKPSAYVPKTKMAFIGLKKEKDRAALIEFLRLRADAPLAPLTQAAPMPGAQEHAQEMPTLETPSEEHAPKAPTEEHAPAEHAPVKDGGH
ncbi:MAG: cytochrome c family protein [Robiginitomaculum sp.]|nr:MAG: cytochrome c family protein [Robiginitomaculum sp.]